jgi:hypothetical protein
MSRRVRIAWLVAVVQLCPTSIVLAAAPDLNGIWARFPDPYGDGPFPDDPPPPQGGPRLREPYATAYKEYQKRKKASEDKGKSLLDASNQCLPEGMPTIMAAVYSIQILQVPKEIVVLAEFLTQTRRIYLNEKIPPASEIMPSYNGYSVGHWEGDTLVVRTVGVREDVRFYNTPHTKDMAITERLRLTAPDRLEDHIKIEDPAVLLVPYEFTFGYKKDSTSKIMEYICDDNHYVASPDGSVDLKVTPN